MLIGFKMKIEIRNLTKQFQIEAELAKGFVSHSLGLSFSKKQRNMLFIMPFPSQWSFWMFGMFYPIKIIFIDENKKIINVETAEPLSFNPKTWKTYAPKQSCKYILEVPADRNFSQEDELSWPVA